VVLLLGLLLGLLVVGEESTLGVSLEEEVGVVGVGDATIKVVSKIY